MAQRKCVNLTSVSPGSVSPWCVGGGTWKPGQKLRKDGDGNMVTRGGGCGRGAQAAEVNDIRGSRLW